MLAALLLAFPHHPVIWWLAMLASGAAAGWAVRDARQSWQAGRFSGNSRWRLLHALDCARSLLGLALALGLLVLGSVARRSEINGRWVMMSAGGAAAVLYLLILAIQARLRQQQAGRG